MNKLPPVFRMCVISREKLLKEDMFRLVCVNGNIVIDKEHNMGGRGVYVKKDLATIQKGHDKHSLSRAFHKEVDESIYLELIQELAKERR